MRAALPRLLFACLAALFAASSAFAASETIFVTVKRTSLRKDRQFYAPTVAVAVFRDQLLVLARERDWARVRFKDVEGWIHSSSTAAKAVSVGPKDAAAGISQDDMALASKGFDASVEREYRKGREKANFAAVDRMEQYTVSEKALADFRKAGNLRVREEQR